MKKNNDDNRIPFGPTPRDIETEIERIEREKDSKSYEDDIRFDIGDIPPVIVDPQPIIIPPRMIEWGGYFYEDFDVPGGETPGERWCISVLDENSNGQSLEDIRQEYLAFRSAWPDRPMFILVPGGGTLRLPDEWGSNILDLGPIEVNRDEGDPEQASDWFNIIGMQYLQPGAKIGLFIDASGSMTLSTVSASFNLFTQRIDEELPFFDPVDDVFTVGNSSERIWIHFTNLQG